MIVAMNCDDGPVQLEIPVGSHVRQAFDVLDAKIHWENEPRKGLELSECEKLPVKDSVLQLELAANSGKIIRITD